MPHDDQTAGNTPNLRAAAAPPRLQLALPLRTAAVARRRDGVAVAEDNNNDDDKATLPPVRVVCHRGDWRNFVENSLEAIISCAEMGADMVEVDVQRTCDGHLVLMHDETLDRTSSGSGPVAQHTLAQLRTLRLKDGLGNMTEYTIPTVLEALEVAKAHGLLVNLDKADAYLDEVYTLLCHCGMLDRVLVKSELPYAKLRARWGSLLDCLVFMPIVTVTSATTFDDIHAAVAPAHALYEVNVEHDADVDKVLLLRDVAAQTGAVLWVNTIWPSTCAGRSDDRALRDADGNWGYAVDVLRCGFIQTDRPHKLLHYLRQRGDH